MSRRRIAIGLLCAVSLFLPYPLVFSAEEEFFQPVRIQVDRQWGMYLIGFAYVQHREKKISELQSHGMFWCGGIDYNRSFIPYGGPWSFHRPYCLGMAH